MTNSKIKQKALEELAGLNNPGVLLQAEVALTQQGEFQKRYLSATSSAVVPGAPSHYQNQPNKWGAELRVYFNGKGLANSLKAIGVHVEGPRNGYMANLYSFRFSDNDLWWTLVEHYGLRLGQN